MRFLRLPLLVLLLHLSLSPWVHSQVKPGAGTDGQDTPVGELTTRDQHYDPLERINDDIFAFNSAFDHFVLEPVAKTYAAVVPLPAQTGIRNAANNLGVARKAVNNLLQARPVAASREVARFIINSTVGIVGIFDMARKLGLEPSDQDMGITLGLYGISHGAYLVLPLLPPTTVRDGLGRVADSFMNPLSYFTPYYVPLSITVADTVNNRSLNMKTYDALKLSIDPYGAVRNAYLQVRQRKLEAARTGGL
ncbi:MAG: VacJ family lipoprotein [Deltaproteobacteria bacterium]|nr:VacJ family lipoprotein [Deltaproteobacteria bacterium]